MRDKDIPIIKKALVNFINAQGTGTPEEKREATDALNWVERIEIKIKESKA